MKKMWLLLVAVLAGCAGTDERIGETELVQFEQAYNAPVSPNFQYGTKTGSTRQRCDRSSTSQVCSIPDSRTQSYCVDFPLGVDIENDIIADVAAIGSATGWTFTKVADCGSAKIQFSLSATGSSGTASNDVKDYATSVFSGITSLTENEVAGEATVFGNYQKHSSCNARIDKDDILAKGTSAAQDRNGWRHATMHAFLACLGIGGRTINANIASRNSFSLNTTAFALSTGEDCVLSAYNPVNNGNFANAGTCASD